MLSLVLLDPRVLGPRAGWRAGFLLGAVLALAILLVRRNVPESPRWLLAHGRADEAERIVAQIETGASARRPAERRDAHRGLRRQGRADAARKWRMCCCGATRERSAVVLALMISQAFFYNAIFFTYALVLTRFYGVDAERVGLYILPVRGGQLAGAAAAGPAVRPRRPAPHDRGDLCAVGRRASR